MFRWNTTIFQHPVDRPEAELVCTICNINFGKNKELLGKCSFLREYMIFIDYVRDFYRENDYEDLDDCIERAIDRCIKEKVNKQKSLEQTALEMEEDTEDIRLLYDITQSYAPDCDEDRIYQTYLEKIQEKAL